jgi:predicted unusual protein kinase regulating ubiquinone biosynthesis (AarF/ABC1/UbiB family)
VARDRPRRNDSRGGRLPPASALGRLVTLGGLVGRVGASLIGQQVAALGRSPQARRTRRTDTLVRNATRIASALGEMKGGAMKVGQMLSLHESLMPPEVAEILSTLQQQAPSVPFELMEEQVREELPDYDALFSLLDPRPHAAASIGQVHRGVLRDGRRVAVKIQYPGIDRIVRADLKNLKTVLGTLFGLVSSVDFRPIWRELRARLLEELDYVNEAANVKRMAELHARVPQIVLPGVVEEASTRRVLTMELVRGIPPAQACSKRYGRKLKDRWGVALFEFQFRGLFAHRFLHADPNIANFAFRRDGRLIVYDYGCIKEIPDWLAEGYADLLSAALEGRRDDIPAVLKRMRVYRSGGAALPRSLTDPYVELFTEILRDAPPYTFGKDPGFYQRLFQMGMAHLPEGRRIKFPEAVVYVDRCLAGHFGNLSRLGATAPWGKLIARHIRRGRGSPPTRVSQATP